MLNLENELCPGCSTPLLDTEEEFVCPRCGAVREKQVVDAPAGPSARPRDWIRPPLGSYMGPASAFRDARTARGITGRDTDFWRLKRVSDYTGRDEGAAVACAKLIERVGENLGLPGFVLVDAAAVADRVLSEAPRSRRTVIASVSAHSLISACRMAGVNSVSPRDILAAHAALGKEVTSSSVIQLAIESPVRTYAMEPEEYLSLVLARLSADPRLVDRLGKEGVPLPKYLNDLREKGREILRLAERTSLSGKRPSALAASAVYSAETALSLCESRGKRLTQRVLAKCGGTSEYTVRDQCAVLFTPAVKKLLARRSRPLPVPAAR